MTAAAFYDALAPFYDLVFEDWDTSIAYQARALTAIIESEWPAARSVLDVSCGIGTQAIALALSGYEVCASDVSAAAVARAGAKRCSGARASPSRLRTCARSRRINTARSTS